MGYVEAIILGIVQGLTEFLPVSSSGHLVLLQNVFGITNNVVLFDIFLHLATLLSVIIVFRKSIWQLITHPFSKKILFLVISTVITGVLALIFEPLFKNAFSGQWLVVGFLITAIVLLLADVYSEKIVNNKQVNSKKAALLGLFQAIAIFPGISRSGSTICGGVFLKIKKETLAEYSFLMSLPIIVLALVYEIIKTDFTSEVFPIIQSLVGFVFAFVFGVLAIKVMLKIIKTSKYFYFSIYLGVLSVFLLLNQFIFNLF